MVPDIFVLRFAYDLQAAGARRILDLGCGSGRNAIHLAARGFEVVGVDEAVHKFAEAKKSAGQQADTSFVASRLESLPFSSSAFDAAVCTHVLEYLGAGQIPVALAELRRVVREGGLLLLVTAAKEGAGLAAAQDRGENDYLFKRADVEVPVHLFDRPELERRLQGWRLREIVRLSVESAGGGRAATIAANWAVVAKRASRGLPEVAG